MGEREREKETDDIDGEGQITDKRDIYIDEETVIKIDFD